MNARQKQSVDRLERVCSSLPDSLISELKGLPPLYAKSVTTLSECVANLRRIVGEQLMTEPNSTHGHHVQVLRRRLRREYMIPAVRATRKPLRFAPGAERALVTPHATASHLDLVSAAERMVKFLRSHRKLLVDAFGPTFLSEMRDTARELKALATKDSDRQVRYRKSARELREELTRGAETVRIIEATLLGPMNRDKNIADSWKSMTRTHKRLGRPKKKRASTSPNTATRPFAITSSSASTSRG
jgi:hypothetical protein